MNKQSLAALSLAMGAGRVVSGEKVLKSVRSNNAYLVLVASDASNNTKKQMFDKSKFYKVPCFEVGESTIISHAVGKQGRMYLAITSPDFAQMIMKKMKEE